MGRAGIVGKPAALPGLAAIAAVGNKPLTATAQFCLAKWATTESCMHITRFAIIARK